MCVHEVVPCLAPSMEMLERRRGREATAHIDMAIRTIALKPMSTGVAAICRRGVAASHATGRDVAIAVEEFLEAAVMRFSFRS